MRSPSSARSSRRNPSGLHRDALHRGLRSSDDDGQLPPALALRGADLRADRHRPEDATTGYADPRDNRYFTLDELRRFRLSLVHQSCRRSSCRRFPITSCPTGTTPQKRLVEHVRMLFFR